MANNASAIKQVSQELGSEQTIELLEFALPHIHQQAQQLDAALSTHNWQQAALYAHKALSSVHLYGSPELRFLLTQLKERNQTISPQAFQLALTNEFNDVITAIEEWLATTKHTTL